MLENKLGLSVGPYDFEVTSASVEGFRKVAGLSGEAAEVPPTYFTCFRDGEFKLFELLEVGVTELLHAEQRFSTIEPLKAGDKGQYSTEFTKFRQKSGRSGNLIFLTFDTRVSVDGKEVGTTSSTVVIRR